MNPIAEVMKGATDLPIALLALVFGLLLRKKGEKGWATLFLLVVAAGALGALVHMFAMSLLTLKLLWAVLYVLLYEVIRRFSRLMTNYISGTDAGEQNAVWITEALLYVGTVGVLIWNPDAAICVLVVFMVLMFARILVCLVRSRKGHPKKAGILLCMVFFPLALQALAGLIPFAVVAEHLTIVACEVLVYLIGAEYAPRPCQNRSI